MGYYRTFYFNVELKEGIQNDEANDMIKEALEKDKKLKSRWEGLIFKNKKLNLYPADYGMLSYEDDRKALFDFLKKIVKKESTIEGEGEESEDRWLVTFDGQGGYKEESGWVIFGDLFDAFLKEYNTILPKKLYDDLVAFRIAQKI